jgi:hypothetical protein
LGFIKDKPNSYPRSHGSSQPHIRGAGRSAAAGPPVAGRAGGGSQSGSERELAEGLDLRGKARERTRKERRGESLGSGELSWQDEVDR